MPTLVNEPQPANETDRHFQTDHLTDDLRGRSVRGGTVTLIAQGTRFVLTLGATAVLARLLRPEDFGLLGMVMAVTGFVALFKDLGLSMATVQRDEVNHAQVSTLFWINVALSLAALLVVAALAPAIAWFFGNPELVGITLVLSAGFLFSGLAVQHQALLQRQMRLTALAVISVLSMTAGIATAITAAFLDFGYWALVFQHLAMALTGTLGLWVLCDWRPGLPRRHSGVRSMLFFGGNLTGFSVVNYLARNLDNVLIGWYWGAQALGFYAKSYSLLLLPMYQINAPLSAVAIPALSRLQGDPERYRNYYKTAVGLIVTVGMPLIAFLFVTADEVVLTILGPQWTASVPIFRALGPAAFLGTFNVATGWVYVSTGQAARQFRWGLVASSILAGSFILGLPWGPVGVALSYSTAFCCLVGPGVLYCFHGSPLRITDLLSTLWPSASAALSAAALVAMTRPLLTRGLNEITSLMILALLFGFLYVAGLLTLPAGRARVRSVISLLHELRPRRVAIANEQAK